MTRTLTSKGKLKITPGLPIGAVVPFCGATLPTGWALCDGSGGTPDLRDRFLIGDTAVGTGTAGGSLSPAAGATHAGLAAANHSNHVATQPSDHPAHVVTQSATHTAHVVTQPAAHGTHATGGAHTHDAHTQDTATLAGLSTDVTGPSTHASQGGHAHDAHSAHAGAAVDTHFRHTGSTLDEGTNLYVGDQSDFEGGIGGWTATVPATLTSSADQALTGTHSLKCVQTGAGNPGYVGPKVAAVAGEVCSIRLSIRANATSRQCQAFILFFDAALVQIANTSSGAVNDLTTGWVSDSIQATAPVNTAFFAASVAVFSGLAGEAHYIDVAIANKMNPHLAHAATAADAHSAHSVTQPSDHSTFKHYKLAYIMRTS